MIQKKTWDAWNIESQMLCSVVLGKGGGPSSNNECFLFEDDVAEVRKSYLFISLFRSLL